MRASFGFCYWLPRILCILAILFISLFALDSFDPELSLYKQLSGFLMHMIPSFILVALLIVAWKKRIDWWYYFYSFRPWVKPIHLLPQLQDKPFCLGKL